MRLLLPLSIALIGVAFVTKAWSVSDMPAAQIEPVTVIEEVAATPEALEERKRQEDELELRRAELTEIEKQIEEKQAKLEAYEARISLELDKLKAAAADLERLRDSLMAQETEDMKRLSQMYGNMKARDAAEILNTMPAASVVRIIDGMTEMQATAVLGAMDAKIAKDVTSMILARGEQLSR